MQCCPQVAMERNSQLVSEAADGVPHTMTAALPAALSAALQRANQAGMLPSDKQADGTRALQVSSLSAEGEQQLRLLVSEELARAVEQLNSAQVSALLRWHL